MWTGAESCARPGPGSSTDLPLSRFHATLPRASCTRRRTPQLVCVGFHPRPAPLPHPPPPGPEVTPPLHSLSGPGQRPEQVGSRWDAACVRDSMVLCTWACVGDSMVLCTCSVVQTGSTSSRWTWSPVPTPRPGDRYRARTLLSWSKGSGSRLSPSSPSVTSQGGTPLVFKAVVYSSRVTILLFKMYLGQNLGTNSHGHEQASFCCW